MNRYFVKAPALACVALIVAVLQCSAAEEPKDVLISFTKALQINDKTAIRLLCTGTDEQFKDVELMSDSYSAFSVFKKACDANSVRTTT